jgi:hypothetical protein
MEGVNNFGADLIVSGSDFDCGLREAVVINFDALLHLGGWLAEVELD